MKSIGIPAAILSLCCAAALALPSRPASADETAHLDDAKPFTPCAAGLTVWVRADDLRPSDIVEGDARLFNNLTDVAHDAELLARCRVQSWTLGLRHRERVAVKYPAPDVELPAMPTYNYTWDTSRRTFNLVEDESAIETILDPHTAERTAYDKQLEEYASAVRNHDHWIVHEEERHNFEASWPMGDVEAPIEHLQIVPSKSFAVAVPAVIFAPKIQYRGSSWSRRGYNISYAQELDLGYVAYVTMADGDVIEVAAGDTTFVPPARDTRKGQDKVVRFDSNTEITPLFAAEGALSEEEDPRTVTLPDLDLTLVIQNLPDLRQGDNVLLNGTVTLNGTSYVLECAKLELVHYLRPTWADAVLGKEKRNVQDLRAELYRTAGVHDYFIKSSPSSKRDAFSMTVLGDLSSTVPAPVASHLEKVTAGCGQNEWSSNRHLWSEPGGKCVNSVSSHATSDLQTWLNVTDLLAHSTREAAFETVESAIVVRLTIRERTVDDEHNTALSRAERIREDEDAEWKTEWCVIGRSPNAKAMSGRRYVISTAVEGIRILPREWASKKRDSHIEKRVRALHSACSQVPVSHLSPLARAPVFVDPTKAGDVVDDLCSSTMFPLLNATTTSRQRQASLGSLSDSTLRFVTNRWHRKRILSHAVEEKGDDWWFGRPGMAGKEVGKLWAEKVLAPIVRREKQGSAEDGGLLGSIKQMVFS